MKHSNKMISKVTSSLHHDKMVRFVAPLNDYFGINHFWYYKITNLGFFSYLGTHTLYSEYCFDNDLLKYFPCLRHPDKLQKGINSMKSESGSDYEKLLDVTWKNFGINFNINLVKSIPDGVEAFGFANRFNEPWVEGRLLNELPLLCQFIKSFRENNTKLFQIIEDNQMNICSEFGTKFHESLKAPIHLYDRNEFKCKIGLEKFHSLSDRELEVLKYTADGYSASRISQALHLSKRTIEHHLERIKDKLDCLTKSDLVQKAKVITHNFYTYLEF